MKDFKISVYPTKSQPRENEYSRRLAEHPFKETIRVQKDSGTYFLWPGTRRELTLLPDEKETT